MNPIEIVGLIGKAGAGKSEAAARLADALNARGKRAMVMSIYQPARAALAAMGIAPTSDPDRDITGLARSYSALHSTLVSDWGRYFNGQDFWVRLLAARIVDIGAAGRLPDVLIVEDVEHPIDVTWMTQKGALLVYVKRGPYPIAADGDADGVELLHNDTDLVGLRARCGSLSNLVLARLALKAGGVPA